MTRITGLSGKYTDVSLLSFGQDYYGENITATDMEKIVEGYIVEDAVLDNHNLCLTDGEDTVIIAGEDTELTRIAQDLIDVLCQLDPATQELVKAAQAAEQTKQAEQIAQTASEAVVATPEAPAPTLELRSPIQELFGDDTATLESTVRTVDQIAVADVGFGFDEGDLEKQIQTRILTYLIRNNQHDAFVRSAVSALVKLATAKEWHKDFLVEVCSELSDDYNMAIAKTTTPDEIREYVGEKNIDTTLWL